VLIQLRLNKDGGYFANFGRHCDGCSQRSNCTESATGRTLRIHAEHAHLRRARERQRHEEWKRNYRAIRPKVERKLAHLVRYRHGGRRARVRGCVRVAQDFVMRCAAVNLKRLAGLCLRSVDARAINPAA
jgi:hypothetical protein